jgi:hypothetical protein
VTIIYADMERRWGGGWKVLLLAGKEEREGFSYSRLRLGVGCLEAPESET